MLYWATTFVSFLIRRLILMVAKGNRTTDTRIFSPLDLHPASSTISENKHLHEDDSPIAAAGRRLSRSGLDAPELVMQGAVF